MKGEVVKCPVCHNAMIVSIVSTFCPSCKQYIGKQVDDSILVEIERPEGYDDVDAEILAADALRHWVRYKVISKEEDDK